MQLLLLCGLFPQVLIGVIMLILTLANFAHQKSLQVSCYSDMLDRRSVGDLTAPLLESQFPRNEIILKKLFFIKIDIKLIASKHWKDE